MFEWNEKTIRWMENAAENSSYYAFLAEKIAARLPPDASIFDGGCGLGHLSSALCRHSRALTAAELSPLALGSLRPRAPENMTLLFGDAFAHRPSEPYDAALFCNVGGVEELLAFWKSGSAKRLILLRNASERHLFSLSPCKRDFSFLSLCGELEGAGIVFSREIFEHEFGQPFSSIEDASEFFAYYDGRKPSPGELLSRLEKTGNPALPYYYPSLKKIGMVVITEENNER